MLNKLRKAQNTAEYAIVLGLVVGAVIAMQVYVRRGLQGRIQEVVDFAGDTDLEYVTGEAIFSGDTQYEPYYLSSEFSVTRDSSGGGDIGATGEGSRGSTDDTTRAVGGFQAYGYNASGNMSYGNATKTKGIPF